jgi:3-hydroxyacyl-CoA dehydrogenase
MTAPSQNDIADYIAKSGHAAWDVPGLSADTPRRTIHFVGIIGAGTMGGGIAMNFASVGIPVRIVETTQDALDRGLAVVRGNYQRSADRGRFPQDEVEARMARFDGRTSLADLADCDLVIEAVFENMDLKKQIFTELDRVMKPGAILATNTSALDINEISSVTKRPQDVIGLHFFSPANVMKLLEIVRADRTADDVVATCMDLAKTINKIAVLVGVCPGFVGNRILFARQIQAQKLLYQGVMPWDVDAALNAFGFKMGPFQMSDLAGLDIGWSKGAKTDNPIRDALCELDRRGQKTKAGFYDYDASRTPIPSDVTAGIIRDITGADAHQMAQQEIIETCIYPMINEALKILEENKAQRPSDIDVVWLNGYGWPADKGGLMFYADMVGAPAILAKMEQLGADDAAFAPAETLRRLARTGGKFTEIDTGGLKTGKGE